MATLWIALQAVVDTLILAAVLFYFFERRNRKKECETDELRKKELKELINSLDQLINESERSSLNISDKAFQSQKEVQVLLDQIEKKQEELKVEGEKAQKVLDKIKNRLENCSKEKIQSPSDKDKY